MAQFFILLGGAVFAVFFPMHTGGLGAGQLTLQAWNSVNTVLIISLDPTQRISVLNIAFSAGLRWIATCNSNQIAMQRFFTIRSRFRNSNLKDSLRVVCQPPATKRGRISDG